MSEEKDYDEMKDKCKKFSDFLIENEKTFNFEINEWNEGLAGYFEFEAVDQDYEPKKEFDIKMKKITFAFGDNGYLGVHVGEKDE